MFLFIFESIGTSELILIGIIALIFLGPRKLPQIAKKVGKVMSDFRNTTNEFKATWQKEVDFEEEKTLLSDPVPEQPVARVNSILDAENKKEIIAPEIKEIDAENFNKNIVNEETQDPKPEAKEGKIDLSDKQDWL